jgi:hypothetical protein
MATSAMSPQTCTLQVNLFSGGRAALPADAEPLLTLRDGNQKNVPLPNSGYFNQPCITVNGLPFFNNFGDSYAVIASAKRHQQAGFHPVPVNPRARTVVDIMLLGQRASYNFHNASWRRLSDSRPQFATLLAAGATDGAAAADRYTQLLEQRPDALACCLNLFTALSQIHLPSKCPLAYMTELIWDDTLQSDRFFAWADPALLEQMEVAEAQRQFSAEPGTALFHPGATRSWKQIQFGEANVQLTFHENDRKTIGGVNCVKVEPDIDYYRDPLAHALLEVVTHALTHSMTDPRQVYVLRWIAGRRAGVPEFDPLYTIE